MSLASVRDSTAVFEAARQGATPWRGTNGGELDSTGWIECRMRAVVGRQATLKVAHHLSCQA